MSPTFPKRWVNPYISAGAGLLRYENANAETKLADGRSLLNVTFGNKPFTVDGPDGLLTEKSNLPADANTLAIIPVGIGFDAPRQRVHDGDAADKLR